MHLIFAMVLAAAGDCGRPRVPHHHRRICEGSAALLQRLFSSVYKADGPGGSLGVTITAKLAHVGASKFRANQCPIFAPNKAHSDFGSKLYMRLEWADMLDRSGTMLLSVATLRSYRHII